VRKNFWVLVLLSVLIFALWHKALFNFFAQDDFILINQFSQNNFWQDIKNVFGLPTVTLWRPFHNLYFFVTGNIFGKNYYGYHFITFAFHIGASFFIYKTVQKLTNDFKTALIAGVIYGVHPAHFVSLFWISGGATMIGFFFLIACFYCYLINKKLVSQILYIFALLASEAMIVGLAIIFIWEVLIKKRRINRGFLAMMGIISTVFCVMRFLILTPKTAFDVYQIEFSTKVIAAFKYYLLRIAGFAEVSGDLIVSLILLGWLIVITMLLVKILIKKQNVSYLILSIIIIIVGLFPFILIPQHLSPHYMNVSIFGFSIMTGLALKNLKPTIVLMSVLLFLGIAVYNINLTKNNNWVVKRSNLAKAYIKQIEKENLRPESEIIFTDNKISTLQEAYIALGTGEAIKFWFKDKNYKTCFTFYENCKKE